VAGEKGGFRFPLITRFDNGVPLRFERMAQHRPQRVLVFDDEDRGIDGLAGSRAHAAMWSV
jgi:hypothetical protein